MSIEEIGAWGDLLGGIGVMAGLIFVGLQLLAANRESRIAANQAFSDSQTTIATTIANNSVLAEIFTRGLLGLDNLEPQEKIQFMTYISTSVMRTYENMYHRFCEGRLDADIWNGAEKTILAVVGTKGFEDIWKLRSDWYSSKFKAYIENLMKDPARLETALTISYGLETKNRADA